MVNYFLLSPTTPYAKPLPIDLFKHHIYDRSIVLCWYVWTSTLSKIYQCFVICYIAIFRIHPPLLPRRVTIGCRIKAAFVPVDITQAPPFRSAHRMTLFISHGMTLCMTLCMALCISHAMSRDETKCTLLAEILKMSLGNIFFTGLGDLLCFPIPFIICFSFTGKTGAAC